MNQTRLLILTTTATLFLFRLWETIMLNYFENSYWWQTIKDDNIEHYQFGILLVILAKIFSKKLNSNVVIVTYGIGIGLIIDEAYQILSLLFGFMYQLNSFFDWISVIASYVLFLVITFLWKNRQ